MPDARDPTMHEVAGFPVVIAIIDRDRGSRIEAREVGQRQAMLSDIGRVFHGVERNFHDL